jgi:hypothetical protein
MRLRRAFLWLLLAVHLASVAVFIIGAATDGAWVDRSIVGVVEAFRGLNGGLDMLSIRAGRFVTAWWFPGVIVVLGLGWVPAAVYVLFDSTRRIWVRVTWAVALFLLQFLAAVTFCSVELRRLSTVRNGTAAVAEA